MEIHYHAKHKLGTPRWSDIPYIPIEISWGPNLPHKKRIGVDPNYSISHSYIMGEVITKVILTLQTSFAC